MQQPPGRKEIKKSGTADWVQNAMAEHQRQQDELATVFGGAAEAVSRQKQQAADAWKLPPEEPGERGPDLFAAERARGEQQKRDLSSVWDADRAARAAEDDDLRNLFGPPKKK